MGRQKRPVILKIVILDKIGEYVAIYKYRKIWNFIGMIELGSRGVKKMRILLRIKKRDKLR